MQDISDFSSRDQADNDLASSAIVALRLLEVVASHRPDVGVSEVAALLGIPKARVHRHLTALKRFHYVTQKANSRYMIGWRFYCLARQTIKQFGLVELARPLMEELRDRVGQTVTISTFLDDEVIVLDFVPGNSTLEIGLRPGSRFKLNWVAQGKNVLAFGPKEVAERFLGGELPPCTRATITSAEAMRRELEIVRAQGWAEAPEQVFLGINAVAAPIFRSDGRLFGSVALVGAIHYLPSPPAAHVIEALASTAKQVSEVLGEILFSPGIPGA